MKETVICKGEGCNKEISGRGKTGFCRSCMQKGERSHRFVDGEESKSHVCVVCGNKICYETWRVGSGRCKSCSNKERFKELKNDPNYKIGERLNPHFCIEPECDNEISYSNWLYGQGRCEECDYKWRKTIEYRSTMSLITGGTGIPYENTGYPPEFYIIRPKILKRDNFTCQGKDCGMTQEDYYKILNKSLHVHHIDHNKQNSSKYNLISLCSNCHRKAHSPKDKQYWIEYYKYKIKTIYQNLITDKPQFVQIF